MFVGMAMAKYWDVDWEKYAFKDNIYETLRDKRGYDEMDEYILEDVLRFKEEKCKKVTDIVAECACITNTFLHNQNIEHGTKEAVEAYFECLHQLYLMGMAMQLNDMGYKMLGLN